MFCDRKGRRKMSRRADLFCMGIKAKIKKKNYVDENNNNNIMLDWIGL